MSARSPLLFNPRLSKIIVCIFLFHTYFIVELITSINFIGGGANVCTYAVEEIDELFVDSPKLTLMDVE